MANLFFPPIPGPVNYLAWLVIVLLMMLWLVYLRIEYGPTVVPITSEQEVGEKLQPLDIANSRRRQRGLGDLDEACFADLQAEAFQQLQMSEPFLGRWIGRGVEKVRKHRDYRRKES
ncbi:Hypothetical protein GLP15_4394 [Giardia lamblia P15]|uniref:Uncharacterized protein n=1 Tax=Giardia intestinalis (strain P15) TaxID=658858 RepID=E1F351_GIAIA|nr:Hypothetical protein GLP15_4394 [Giardia lamblia P15]